MLMRHLWLFCNEFCSYSNTSSWAKNTADTDMLYIRVGCSACRCAVVCRMSKHPKWPVNSRSPDVGPGWRAVDRVTRRDPAQDSIKLTCRDQACKTCLLNNTWSDSAVLGSFSSELYWVWQGQAEREREREAVRKKWAGRASPQR